MMPAPTVVVHGGAGTVAPEFLAAAEAGVRAAAEHGQEVLRGGADAETAALEAVRHLEDDPTFNAGRGSCMMADGSFEMDAALMRSRDMKSGAVAAVPNVRDTIRLAQLVLRETRHCLLAGPGAVRLAELHGVGAFGRDEVWTPKAQARFDLEVAGLPTGEVRADTVGAVVLDANGDTAAACSTGGISRKLPGRVGDSPIVGAGLYADPRWGASCATGVGEAILTRVMAFEVLRRCSSAASDGLDSRVADFCEAVRSAHDGAGVGLIVVRPDGAVGLEHASQHMTWAVARGDSPVESGCRRNQRYVGGA